MMDVWEVVKVIGSMLAIVVTVGGGVFAYLWKQRDQRTDDRFVQLLNEDEKQIEHIDRLTTEITGLKDNLGKVENEALKREARIFERFADLPDDFVPRPELSAIVEGLRRETHNTNEMLTEMRTDMKEMLRTVQAIVFGQKPS